MADAWARFVKTGDPNGGDLPPWPRYTCDDPRYLALGARPQAGAFGVQPGLDFIRNDYAARLRP